MIVEANSGYRASLFNVRLFQSKHTIEFVNCRVLYIPLDHLGRVRLGCSMKKGMCRHGKITMLDTVETDPQDNLFEDSK